MSDWHGGKGSNPRPVNKSKFNENFDRIFGRKNMDFEDVFVVYCTECDNSEILVKGESPEDYRCSNCGGVLEGE
jgi:ribosomal protein S27E